MAIFYLDLEGGNDAADGTSFANRWKTFASGATAARIAPGDEIRVMGSPVPTLADSTASWTAGSTTITLSGALTANIDRCETAWTASANVTSTADTSIKTEGTRSAKHVIAGAFTTGLAAYNSMASTDFSAYQQISFYIYSSAAITAGQLQIKLCSDAAGATPVNSVDIPSMPSTNTFYKFTVDTGGALGAAIQSVALYVVSDLGASAVTIYIDNILACKAPSAADSLSLTSYIGKVHNLPWVASTTYAANSIRCPTSPNRNGYRYKVTAGGGGSSGGSEPTWPQYIGGTVVDGALTWTCEGLEDAYYPILSINGTAVTIYVGSGGYPRESETAAAYIVTTIPMKAASLFADINAIQDSGTQSSLIRFTGGWDRTNMTTQNSVTRIDAVATVGIPLNYNSKNFVSVENFQLCGGYYGVQGIGSGCRMLNVHINGYSANGIQGSGNGTTFQGVNVVGIGLSCFSLGGRCSSLVACSATNCSASGFEFGMQAVVDKFLDCIAKYNGNHGITAAAGLKAYGLITGGNGASAVNTQNFDVSLYGCTIPEATVSYAPVARLGRYLRSQDHNAVGTHLLITEGGTIISATDQRHTASGISWKFRPTATTHDVSNPLKLCMNIAVNSGTATTVQIWTRRDNTNIKGLFMLRGGQIAGVPVDVTVACEPAINTWVQSGALSFTPSANGVVELCFLVWDGVGTTNNYWIDDLSVS